MDLVEFSTRIGVACALGFLVGLERQLSKKSAGIKTNTLVALGAATYVLLSIRITDNNEGDITRIIGQVVTGVGFLCAGVILQHKMSIQGLTTAATVWCSSAIACTAAAGYYIEACIVTAVVMFVNFILRKFEGLTKLE